MSKAFDTIDHHILISKLHFYGIRNTELNWFTSYLTNRSQFVEIDDTYSNLLMLNTGVPQGSILGPLLFIIYINDISNSTTFFNFIMYADDTSLSSSINTSFTSSKQFVRDINSALQQVHIWLSVNKLSLNINKTKYIVFKSKNKSI